MPPATPARISLPDRYRVVRHLASGGMAAVWEAHDELLDRDVAVKILAPHLGEDERARRRFQREARAAAGLSSHQHVVTIYDVGEHAARVFMVMEIMRGGTLGDRLKSGREIPWSLTARWMREAAEALDAADEAGVVHRDIKPGNLLLDGNDRLAVADFGIARIALEDQLTATGQVLGTAAYISPEQAMGEPATAASDRYGLAVVAYELLTGTRPFDGGHFAAQARAHVEDPPPPPSSREPGLSKSVDAVMEKALAKDPRDRYASAAEFAAALDRALAEPETAKTRRLGPRGMFGRGDDAEGRGPAAAGGGAAAAGALGAAAAGERAWGDDAAPGERGRGGGGAAGGGGAPPPGVDRGRGAAADHWGWAGDAADERPGRVGAAGPPDGTSRPVGAPGGPPRRRGSAALLVGVSALLLLAVVGAIALASRGGGGGSQQQAQTGSKSKATATATAAHTSAPDKKATATPTQSPAPTTTTPPPTATPSVAAGSPDLAQARSLQLAGFNARRAGDYSTALAKAKAALAACGSTHQLDPCGYALFEEGAALNRGGDPAGAIPILQQRLSSYGDNASGEVSKELQDAQARAAGKPGKGKAKGKGKGGD